MIFGALDISQGCSFGLYPWFLLQLTSLSSHFFGPHPLQLTSSSIFLAPPSPHPRRFSFGNLRAKFPLGAWGEHSRQKATFLKKLSF